MTPAVVVVVVPIGVVRGLQVDISVSMTKVTITRRVMTLRTAGLRRKGSWFSPHPESY